MAFGDYSTCGTETGWTSPDNCRQEAANIIVGAEGATGDDSLACRAYHLGVAKIGAAPGKSSAPVSCTTFAASTLFLGVRVIHIHWLGVDFWDT